MSSPSTTESEPASSTAVAATHSHPHPPRGGRPRAMVLAFVLTSGFMTAELVGGLWANSLALVADAGHMVSDAAALGLGLFAMWIASRPHTEKRTFGFHRAEILAALANGALLVAIALYVSVHAIARLTEEQEVASGPVMIIAAVGLCVNLIAMKVLDSHRHGSLNVRGAFLHIVGDALGSVGVLVSGLVIYRTGWTPIDGIVSLLIAALILFSGWRLVRETVSVLLESSPNGLDTDAVRRDLTELDGVRDVHDLHVWTVTSGFVSLSAHAQVTSSDVADDVLRRATVLLRERYGIRHVTIQAETTQIHDELEHCCLNAHEPSLTFRRFLNES